MWLAIPDPATSFASLASAPAAEGWSSASSWLCRTLASSAEWSGKPLPPGTWSKRCAQVPFMQRLSGAICEPSTADAGVDAWTSLLRATPASRSAQQGSALAQMILAISGPTFVGSSRRWSREYAISRTWAATFGTASSKSTPIWKLLATRLRRVCLLRRKSGQATSESDSLFSLFSESPEAPGRNWATPAAWDEQGTTGGGQGRSLRTDAAQWATPDAPGPGAGVRNRQESRGAGHQLTIAEQAEHCAEEVGWQIAAAQLRNLSSGVQLQACAANGLLPILRLPQGVGYQASERRHWLRLLGNGVVPLAAAYALSTLLVAQMSEEGSHD